MDPAPVGDKGDPLEELVHLFLAVTEAPIYLETLKKHQARVKKMPRPLRMVTAQEKQRNLLKVRFDTTGQGRVARMFSGNKANDGQPELNKGYDRVGQPGFWVRRDKNWPVIDSLYIDGDTVYLIQVSADREHSASGFNQGLIDRLRASPAMASCSKWRIVWAIPQGALGVTEWDEEAHKLFEDEEYVFELPADRAEKELQEYLCQGRPPALKPIARKNVVLRLFDALIQPQRSAGKNY
mmetsp:Transcript_54089/g.136087  ORF Transcript_54089/g.136087 Transcript_54089/m.136087 type:complete len:239 (+) Transcript_54089:1294-2010(+)